MFDLHNAFNFSTSVIIPKEYSICQVTLASLTGVATVTREVELSKVSTRLHNNTYTFGEPMAVLSTCQTVVQVCQLA